MSTAAFKRRLAAVERKLAKPPPYAAVPSPRVRFIIHVVARHFGRLKKGEPVLSGYARAAGYRGMKALIRAVEHKRPHRFADRHRSVCPAWTNEEIEAVRAEVVKVLNEPPAPDDGQTIAPPEPGSPRAIFMERLASMRRNSEAGAG